MKKRRGQNGSALPAVMMFLVLFTFLLFLAMMRFEAGSRLARERYHARVALDMAENGIEYERMMLGAGKPAAEQAPHKMNLGKFEGRNGGFEVFTRAAAPSAETSGKMAGPFIEIVSTGSVEPRADQGGKSRVKVLMAKDLTGSWVMLKREENRP